MTETSAGGPTGRGGYLLSITVAVAVIGVGCALYLALFHSGGAGPDTSAAPSNGLATAAVVRTTVATHDLVSGTLGYSNSTASLTAAVGGVIETVPRAGATIRRGGVLYRLGGQPALLLYGPKAAWRTLVAGMSGADVRALNANLQALGYLPAAAAGSDYGPQTETAVRRLQEARGAEVTGIVALGDVVFAPGAVRVAAVPVSAGQIVEAGAQLIQIASAQQVVSIALDATQQTEVHIGNPVQIELPDGSSTGGIVSDIARVATSPAADSPNPAPTIAVTVRLRGGQTTGLDQAPVQVSITTASDSNVLAVPVGALLAQPGGSYAVQVVRGATAITTPVTPGRFSDTSNLVAIGAGSALHVGDQVVVPG
jgi:peptidoglycan hydrolase-like protein with peptidoglycan-binding domain